MVSSARTKNTIQKLDVNKQNSGNPATIGTTAFVLYTCPTGKVALVKSFKWRATGFGAGTEMNARAKSQKIDTTTAVMGSMREAAGNGIRLVAGETIDLIGDSAANNESAFFDVTVQELPA